MHLRRRIGTRQKTRAFELNMKLLALLWYRLGNARFIRRLYEFDAFENFFGAAVMKSGRAKRAIAKTTFTIG